MNAKGGAAKAGPPFFIFMDGSNQAQRIWVFQQGGRAAGKIAAVAAHDGKAFCLRVFTIDAPLPPVIDDASPWIPERIDADLVLDHLQHPDLSHALALTCREKQIPLIASGKKGPLENAFTPRTCCALVENKSLGPYGRLFGMPAFIIFSDNGVVSEVTVVRGAPCGATWGAAKAVTGLTTEEAAIRIGLETQYRCVADPSGWDPIGGKSPVHIAGELHKAAFTKALAKGKHRNT